MHSQITSDLDHTRSETSIWPPVPLWKCLTKWRNRDRKAVYFLVRDSFWFLLEWGSGSIAFLSTLNAVSQVLYNSVQIGGITVVLHPWFSQHSIVKVKNVTHFFPTHTHPRGVWREVRLHACIVLRHTLPASRPGVRGDWALVQRPSKQWHICSWFEPSNSNMLCYWPPTVTSAVTSFACNWWRARWNIHHSIEFLSQDWQYRENSAVMLASLAKPKRRMGRQ
jgi:hypothetical protein